MSQSNFGGVKLKPYLHGISIIWALHVIQNDCFMLHIGIRQANPVTLMLFSAAWYHLHSP